MKITKFVVVSNAKDIGLFPAATGDGIFAGWDYQGRTIPVFGDEPVLFRLSHARFLVRELRRAGYYVSARPYVLFMIRGLLLVIRSRLVRRKLAKAAWRK